MNYLFNSNSIMGEINRGGVAGKIPIKNPIVSDYWSQKRDAQLTTLAMNNDYFTIALYNVIIKLVAIQPTLVQEGEDDPVVELLQRHLSYIWSDVMIPALMDLFTTDNGMFIEILGSKGNSTELEPVEIAPGVFVPAFGLKHLSSHQCTRTDNKTYPVIYTDKEGKETKLHHSRIYTLTDMNFNFEGMNGVGFCAMSRVLQSITKNTAIQDLLIDMAYDGLVGDIVMVYPTTLEQIEEGFNKANIRMRNRNEKNVHRKKTVFISSTEEPQKVDVIPVRRLPNDFSDMQELKNMMNILAAALSTDARELMPATTFGATKADTEMAHTKSRVKLVKWFLERMVVFLNDRYLPQGITTKFDYLDDLQEQIKMETRQIFAETVKTEIEIGVISRQTAREQYLENKYITEEQFVRDNLTIAESPLTIVDENLFEEQRF
jgi:hypothetical protein